MGEKTAISWCDHTFNPWWQCRRVSPACDNCYAATLAARFGYGWDGAERRTFGDAHWQQPLRWAKTMPAKLGRRPRVFCASMGDWLDLDAPLDEFVRLLDTIRLTPELDWLLLTKRIGNWRKRMDQALRSINPEILNLALVDWITDWLDGDAPANVWIGATVIDQAEADRDIPKLLQVPARVRFLSIEPMLGAIDLSLWLRQVRDHGSGEVALDDEVRLHRREDGEHIARARNLPSSARLPSVALDAGVIPSNVATKSGLQPRQHFRGRAVDGEPRAIGSSIAPTPVQVALAVEKAGRIGAHSDRLGDGNGLRQLVGAAGPEGHAGGDQFPIDGGPARANLAADLADAVAGSVSAHHGHSPVVGSLKHGASLSAPDCAIAWVICGGESGPHARPAHPDWFRSLAEQCRAAGVAFFMKQLGGHPDKRADMAQFPPELRVQEFPA